MKNIIAIFDTKDKILMPKSTTGSSCFLAKNINLTQYCFHANIYTEQHDSGGNMNISRFVLGIFAKASKTQTITDEDVIKAVMGSPEARSYKSSLESHRINGEALSKERVDLQLSMRFRYPASSMLNSFKARGYITNGKITDRGKREYESLL